MNASSVKDIEDEVGSPIVPTQTGASESKTIAAAGLSGRSLRLRPVADTWYSKLPGRPTAPCLVAPCSLALAPIPSKSPPITLHVSGVIPAA